MLRGAIDVAVLAQPAQPVLDAVVVHEMENLLASARGSESAGMRDTHRQGEREHGDDRYEEWGGAETHFDKPTEPRLRDPSEPV
jgi:hypothetical protein